MSCCGTEQKTQGFNTALSHFYIADIVQVTDIDFCHKAG